MTMSKAQTRTPMTMHGCTSSVITEICIPGTNLVFCVESVSCVGGKITVKTSIETRERKNHSGVDRPILEEKVILKDCYTLEVKHLIPEK